MRAFFNLSRALSILGPFFYVDHNWKQRPTCDADCSHEKSALFIEQPPATVFIQL